uniref:Fucosyltransferase n=1 Tax=Electrophorus electricus TaxID=8005 RepID=A0A4W4ERX6_ELEEL
SDESSKIHDSSTQDSLPPVRPAVVLLLVVLISVTLYYGPSFQCLSRQLEPTLSSLRPVLILVWLWPFNKTFELDLCKPRFNIDGCILTADRELYRNADAVLVHHRDIAWDLSNLPQSPRPAQQKWIWMNSESPSNSLRIPGLNSLFNASLSYRRDADITVPYGSLVPLAQVQDAPATPEKSKLVCWIVSNYKPEHMRAHYYRELQKHVPIHVYGDFFNRHVSEQEYREIVSGCKFYLSFENSEHEDYITEKLFNALELGTVPVVQGPSRQNYERVVPGDTFIHVQDFPSMAGLARHLLLLNENHALYHCYFRWRRQFQVKISSFPIENACHSCDYIRRNRKYQVLTDLYQWYWEMSERGDLVSFLY